MLKWFYYAGLGIVAAVATAISRLLIMIEFFPDNNRLLAFGLYGIIEFLIPPIENTSEQFRTVPGSFLANLSFALILFLNPLVGGILGGKIGASFSRIRQLKKHSLFALVGGAIIGVFSFMFSFVGG